ncbi:unnamed protein product [Macrosiphum euphorbiae]|uniref:Uncharacterized protein n=1 Tax=Macrosiphum euphorbiae TaxID=13131 RepID=A0AAV0WR51_9HEMI|nr:unnamed protein product [Macrosiphum euphorbiae]
MALPLLPKNCIAEGFETVRAYYNENVQSLISNNNDYNFKLLFEYYRTTWLAGINADILSVSDTVWRTNNVLKKGIYQYFILTKELITYWNGVFNDYNEATDGGQHLELQLPAIPVLPATALPQAPLQEEPSLLPLNDDQHQELIRDKIMRRILPRTPAVPVPCDLFYNLDADVDYSDEDVSNEQSVIPSVIYIVRVDLIIVPIVEETCYICLYSPPTVVEYPCLHQILCGACHDSYSEIYYIILT